MTLSFHFVVATRFRGERLCNDSNVSPSVCLSRRTIAAATYSCFYSSIVGGRSMSPARAQQRAASCGDPRYDKQHRLVIIWNRLLRRRFLKRTKACWYNWQSVGSLGWPFPMLKYKYIFQIKCAEAILSKSIRKLLWFEIAKMLIAVLESKFVVSFIIIFGTLSSFPIR